MKCWQSLCWKCRFPKIKDANSGLFLFQAQEPGMRRAIEQWTAAAALWKNLRAISEYVHAQAAAAFLNWSLPT